MLVAAGKFVSVKDVQPEKAPYPIVVTLGKETEVKDVHPPKAT
jgi:hypothetical protein